LQARQTDTSDTDNTTDTDNDNNNSDKSSLKNYENNKNNNNINNDSNHQPTHHRFANTNSSPSLEDFTNTVSFASLNVHGINNPVKFESILEDLTGRSFSVIGLQETKTKIESANALFNKFVKRNAKASTYRAYWDFNHQDKVAGVGIIIASYISKFVQRIHKKEG
jgi:hypothetical protein